MDMVVVTAVHGTVIVDHLLHITRGAAGAMSDPDHAVTHLVSIDGIFLIFFYCNVSYTCYNFVFFYVCRLN